MRAMLIWAAAFALPFAAIAQPAASGDAPAKVPEPIAQTREAAPTSEVVVRACAMPADSEGYSTRSSRRVANAEFDAPSYPADRIKEGPETRAFILRNIAAFRSGTADYDHMSRAIAQITRANLPLERLWIACRGTFKGISFLHVSEDGFDDFEVDFSGAAIEWEVDPFNSHHRTDHWAARFYYPEPMTRRFNDFLRSMERGRPDYGRLAPDFVPALQAQWLTLQQAFKKWRGPHSIVFLRKKDDGSYTYKVAYGDHVVFWTVAPLDAAGKITGLTYEEGV